MPIIWRYLLHQYLKVVGLAVLTFLLVLFVSRLRQLTQFALLGSGFSEIFRFALFLIPYVLPVALPIGCLIGALLLFLRLSASHELVALRASGLGLRHILTPLLMMATALTLANFYIASELATHCHLLGTRMKSDKSAVNPLLLLQNTKLLALNDTFVDMRTIRTGEEAEAITIAFHNQATKRLNLVTADRLYRQEDLFCGDRLSVISPIPNQEGFDQLLVENQGHMGIDSSKLTSLLSTTSWQPKNHYLRLRLLLMRLAKDRRQLQQADSPRAVLERRIWRGYAEIARRISLSLSVLTFTLMGCAFGTDPARHPSRRQVIESVLLAGLFIGSFLAAGELGDVLPLALTLYFAPHLLITVLSWRRLALTTKGKTA